MLKTNAPDRQVTLVRLTVAVIGLGLLAFAWFQVLQWAGGEP